MEAITFEELITSDDRSLRFTPLGFSTGGVMTPEHCVEHHQATIQDANLTAEVPEPIRRNFERFRAVHTYGVLLYDLFTVVDDFCVFVLEQALGHRLLEHFGGQLPLTNAHGDVHPLKIHWFDEIHEAMYEKGGSHFRGRWFLPINGGRDSFHFTGSFRNLFKWARAEGFLRGQGNRQVERALLDRRNRAAHPTGHHLVGPVNSAPTIRDIAEIINHLWGTTTENGRLYPSPRKRDILAICWNQPEMSWSTMLAHNLSHKDEEGATYLLVRGVLQDEHLLDFATDFETTMFPTELLWGPSALSDAIDWLEKEDPEPDVKDHLDRPFLIEVKDGVPQRPRRPEVAASLLGESESESEWYLVLADYPQNAFHHVRTMTSTLEHREKVCFECNTTTVTVGNLVEVMEKLQESYGSVEPIQIKGVQVPTRW